ncbi:hypothetical protein ABPG72_009791 [Tetrahymena utriculariae]
MINQFRYKQIMIQIDQQRAIFYEEFTFGYLDNIQEYLIESIHATNYFILDKQLNRMILERNLVIEGKIVVYDEKELKVLDTLKFLFYNSQLTVQLMIYLDKIILILLKQQRSVLNLIFKLTTVSSKRLTNFGLIDKLQLNLIDYHFDTQSGLSFILADKVYVYDSLQQEYVTQISLDLTYSYAIYYIQQLEFILISTQTKEANFVDIYKLSSQQYITSLDYDIKYCFYSIYFYYDELQKRLFSCCGYPGTVKVWNMQNNFKQIKILKQIAEFAFVTQINFYPQKGVLMVLDLAYIYISLYCWSSYIVDYYTLEKKCQIVCIYGNFDYNHNLQMTWDQNGDFRIFNFGCYQLAYQHAHTGWIQQLLIGEKNMLLTTIGFDQYEKVWDYKNITQPLLLYQNFLQYSLNDGFVDQDNNLLLIADFKGFIYILSYPYLSIRNNF